MDLRCEWVVFPTHRNMQLQTPRQRERGEALLSSMLKSLPERKFRTGNSEPGTSGAPDVAPAQRYPERRRAHGPHRVGRLELSPYAVLVRPPLAGAQANHANAGKLERERYPDGHAKQKDEREMSVLYELVQQAVSHQGDRT